MSDTESFEHAMAEMRKVVVDCDMERCDMYDGDCYQCQGDILDRMQRAHERELEHVRKAEFARGYDDGQRSMDAEHYAVALRLRGLRFDGGSHDNLSRIAYAIYPCATGWTCESSEGLRDRLIDLLGGVHEPDAALPTYDVLGNERQKAVRRLREIQTDAGGFVKALANALGVEWQAPRVVQTIAEVRDRLIHLLGGDEPTLREIATELSQAIVGATSMRADQSHESSPMRQESETGITDELRERIAGVCKVSGLSGEKLYGIADRIDEQEHKLRKQSNEFKRAMCAAQDLLEKRIEERDELQRKLDSMAQEYIAMRSALEISSSAMKEVIVERDELQDRLDAIREAVDAAQ